MTEVLKKKYCRKLLNLLIEKTDGDDMLLHYKKLTLKLWFTGSHKQGKKLKQKPWKNHGEN